MRPWQMYQPGVPEVPADAQVLCEPVDWETWTERCDARGVEPFGRPDIAVACGRIEVGWLPALDLPVLRVTTYGEVFTASRQPWGSAN